jgi:hypothetical protein
MALGARGFSMADAAAHAREMVREAERESRAGGRGNPPGYGDIFLQQVHCGDRAAVDAYDARRVEGVTDADIRWYWNLADVEKRVLEKLMDVDRAALFVHAMVEEAAMHPDYSFDELGQLCGWRVRKVHAMYGDPSDTTHGWGDDRPLYPELKDRVDTYIEAAFTNLGVLHHDAQRYSSFNALVRAKMRTCEL